MTDSRATKTLRRTCGPAPQRSGGSGIAAGIAVALSVALSVAAGTARAEPVSPFVGLWCVTEDERGICLSIFEVRDDESYVNYNLDRERNLRLDITGVWRGEPGEACFLQNGWISIDLLANETIDTGTSGLDSFYCNRIISATDEQLVVTHPSTDEPITASRIEALPDWATQ